MTKTTSFLLALLPFLGLISACGGGRYVSQYNQEGFTGNQSRIADALGGPVLTESLFDYKERTLSEADIRYILDGHIHFSDTVRLAIFNLGGNVARFGAWRWNDEEGLKTQQQLIDTLTRALRRSGRVHKVILLPSIVTGSKPNIYQLRESAVRVQADMLLVFSLYSDLFRKYRAFKKDEAKAFATSEAILMDVRTGIIPHTSVVTKSAQSLKEKSDFSTQEMEKRALYLATLEALLETGNKTAAFLEEQKK